MYCAQKLPDFLKEVEAYRKGDYEQALKDAFIGFDSTLVDAAVVDELKKLTTDVLDGSESEEDADDDENLQELFEERNMDINDVLQKYENGKGNPAIERVSGAKPSPFLRGRRNCGGDDNAAGTSGPSSSNCVKLDDNEDAVSSTSKQKTEEIAEAATSSGSGSSKNEVGSDPSSTNETTTKPVDTNCSPVSSSTSKNTNDVQLTNGDASTAKPSVPSQENEISTNSSKVEKVSSSSQSGSQSNGEISSNSTEKQASNSSISSTKDIDSDDSTTDDDEYNEGEWSSIVLAAIEGGDFNGILFPISDKSSDGNDEDDEDDEDEDEEDEDEENVDDDDEDGFAYEDEDEGFLSSMVEGPGQSSGCTAVVALLVDRELYVANAGDSRCVLCRNGKTVEMSFDHKPEDDEESTRITKAGGRVTLDGRVNGGLNLSRAIGDHAYKMNKDLKPEEQMISAMPDVKRITLEEDDEFMVLACDGIWNYMTSEEVVEFVRKRLSEKTEKLSSICEEVTVDFCHNYL